LGKEIPRMEDHIALIWIPLNQIDEIDFRPAPLKKLFSEWLDVPSGNFFKSEIWQESEGQ